MFRVKVDPLWVIREIKSRYNLTDIEPGFVRAIRRELNYLLECDLTAGGGTSSGVCLGIAVDSVCPQFAYMQLDPTPHRPNTLDKPA